MIDFMSYYPGYDVDTVKSSIYGGVSPQSPLDTQGGYLAFLVSDNNAGLNEWMRIEKNGNVLVGTNTADGTAAGVLGIANGTAPAAGTANQSYLYAKDVSSSSEMFVMDEAGNETQISPHDPETGEWVFYSVNRNTGKAVRIHMDKLVAAVEKLTGEDFTEGWVVN